MISHPAAAVMSVIASSEPHCETRDVQRLSVFAAGVELTIFKVPDAEFPDAGKSMVRESIRRSRDEIEGRRTVEANTGKTWLTPVVGCTVGSAEDR